jgi:hypothetical protein
VCSDSRRRASGALLKSCDLVTQLCDAPFGACDHRCGSLPGERRICKPRLCGGELGSSGGKFPFATRAIRITG